jgi:hypothetical protein
MKQLANIGIGVVLSLGLLGLPAAAQDQSSNPASGSSDSLGTYARQVKKDGSPKAKAKVFDNDNLPTQDKLSIVGPAPATAADSAAPAASQADTTASAAAANQEKASAGAATTATEVKPAADDKALPKSAPAKDLQDDVAAKQAAWKQWGERITAQKEQIDLLTRELDVLQREYQIRAAAMYADAGNRMRNSTDWDKQDAQYKQQIADKQKALDDAKQKLDDMQEDARKAGTPASVREP